MAFGYYFDREQVNLTVSAEKGQESVVRRDLKVGAESRLSMLVDGAHGRKHVDHLAG